MICDSIAKYVTAQNTTVQAFPGKTVSMILDRIVFNSLSVSGYNTILIHLGTNDIDNKLSGRQDLSIWECDALFRALISAIRIRNNACYILLAGIIPRLTDHFQSWPLIYGLNFKMQAICCEYKRAIYVPAEKFFFRSVGGYFTVRSECYELGGKLHLNGAGVQRLIQCFQQALSPRNVYRELHWRKNVAGVRLSGPPVAEGNNLLVGVISTTFQRPC